MMKNISTGAIHTKPSIRKADVLMSEIEKSSNTAEIAVKACEIVGILTGDENFPVRQKRKINNA